MCTVSCGAGGNESKLKINHLFKLETFFLMKEDPPQTEAVFVVRSQYVEIEPLLVMIGHSLREIYLLKLR